MMDWVKVTPETMPPDMEPVIGEISAPLFDGGPTIDYTAYNICWSVEKNSWMRKDPQGSESYVEQPDGKYVKRWTPMQIQEKN